MRLIVLLAFWHIILAVGAQADTNKDALEKFIVYGPNGIPEQEEFWSYDSNTGSVDLGYIDEEKIPLTFSCLEHTLVFNMNGSITYGPNQNIENRCLFDNENNPLTMTWKLVESDDGYAEVIISHGEKSCNFSLMEPFIEEKSLVLETICDPDMTDIYQVRYLPKSMDAQ